VNAALMAGGNVTEGGVRKVFSGALDVVVHLDRDDIRGEGSAIRRQVTGIAAGVPALRDAFTVEALFVRQPPGEPLRWTRAGPRPVPDSLAQRLARAGGPRLADILESSEGHAVGAVA